MPQVFQSNHEMLANCRNSLVRREEVGSNTYEAHDRFLTFSFPSLCMFGTAIKRPCGVSEAHTRHMLLQYDNCFAEARDFCVLLFNEKFRHTALPGVRDSIYANPNRMKAFETAVNTKIVYSDHVGHQTSDIRLFWTAISQTINPPPPPPPCDVVHPPPNGRRPPPTMPPPLWPYPRPSTTPSLMSAFLHQESWKIIQKRPPAWFCVSVCRKYGNRTHSLRSSRCRFSFCGLNPSVVGPSHTIAP